MNSEIITMKTELVQVNANAFELTPLVLEGLGLVSADMAEIEQVAQRIQASNPSSVSEFGRDVAEHTSSYADSLLDQVRNSDLDVAGAKLTEVVSIALSCIPSAPSLTTLLSITCWPK